MENKLKSVGLDFQLIKSKYPNLNEYEEIICSFFSDPHFIELKQTLENEDYEMAKDMIRGLSNLSQELCLFNLYYSLVDILEDLEEEDYKEVMKHHDLMLKEYKKLKDVFYV